MPNIDKEDIDVLHRCLECLMMLSFINFLLIAVILFISVFGG